MGPLSADEARELALRLLGGDEPSRMEVAETVARESGGNPFFLYELVHNLRAGGSGPGTDISLDEVIGDPDAGDADGGAAPPAADQPRDTGLAHEPLDALAADANPAAQAQLGVDAPGAVGAVRDGMNLSDLLDQNASVSARSDGARRCQS